MCKLSIPLQKINVSDIEIPINCFIGLYNFHTILHSHFCPSQFSNPILFVVLFLSCQMDPYIYIYNWQVYLNLLQNYQFPPTNVNFQNPPFIPSHHHQIILCQIIINTLLPKIHKVCKLFLQFHCHQLTPSCFVSLQQVIVVHNC